MNKPANMRSELTISRLAKAAGVNVETIRYYQRIGLIEEPDKPKRGYRKYTTATVAQIMFVKRAQKLGFSLQEVADLMALGNGHCNDVRERAKNKRDKIEAQIRDLQALRDTLNQLISTCREGNNKHKCPIVEALLAHDEKSNA